MDAEQELREFQREYLDFLDDEVNRNIHSKCVASAPSAGGSLHYRRTKGCIRRRSAT